MHALPGLLDEAVGHSGNVVGGGTGEAFGRNFGLMVGGEKRGVLDEGAEETLDYGAGVSVILFHVGGEIEVGVEEVLEGGALGFDGCGELDEALGEGADLGEGFDVCGTNLMGELEHEVGGERVENALDGLGGDEARDAGGIGTENFVVEAAEERDGFASLLQLQAAGIKAIVEIGGKVSDLVGEVDELGFKGRAFVE